MTPTEREEGRRLLDEFDNAKPPVQSHVILSLEDWLWEHKKSLLADHENISRAVVREFAGAVITEAERLGVTRWNDAPLSVILKLAAARGVTLEKP